MRSFTDFPSGTCRNRMSGLTPPGSIQISPSSGPCSSRPSASLQKEATNSGSLQSMTMFCQRRDMPASLAAGRLRKYRVTYRLDVTGGGVALQRVRKTAICDTGKVERAAHRLFESILPVVRIHEESVDTVLDGSAERVCRRGHGRRLDNCRLEVFELRLRVAEDVGLERHDVEVGRPDQRLQREEVCQRQDVDPLAETAQRAAEVEKPHDEQAHVLVSGHHLRKRAGDQLEVTVVRGRA